MAATRNCVASFLAWPWTKKWTPIKSIRTLVLHFPALKKPHRPTHPTPPHPSPQSPSLPLEIFVARIYRCLQDLLGRTSPEIRSCIACDGWLTRICQKLGHRIKNATLMYWVLRLPDCFQATWIFCLGRWLLTNRLIAEWPKSSNHQNNASSSNRPNNANDSHSSKKIDSSNSSVDRWFQ